MSSQDLAQPRADLSSLPEELLKQIVELVDDQDRKISKLGIAFEGTSGQYSDESRWPVQYKHGLHALSLTSRRMRALALPLLFATVTPKQLAKPFFHLGCLPTVAVDAILCIDMQSCAEPNLLDVAIALPSIHNLRRIKLGDAVAGLFMSTLQMRSSVMLQENREIIKGAFVKAAARIESLDIEVTHKTPPLTSILDCFTTRSSLQSLRVRSKVFSLSTVEGLVEALHVHQELRRLTTEDLAKTNFEHLSTQALWQSLCLPSIEHLALRASDSTVLPFAVSFAPNVTAMRLYFPEAMKTRSEYSADRAAFPALQHLTLRGSPACVHILSSLDAPQLSTLELKARMPSRDEAFDCAALLEHDVLPPTLVGLRIILRLGSHFANIEPLLQWCAQHSTHLRLSNATPFAHFGAPPSSSAPTAPREGQKLAVQRTLAWATERVEMLSQWGDGRGLEELAWALRRVREREAIEHM
ncbi:hypothetical protein JCM10449v2_004879 [Rhodotorula kratochvilovae]